MTHKPRRVQQSFTQFYLRRTTPAGVELFLCRDGNWRQGCHVGVMAYPIRAWKTRDAAERNAERLAKDYGHTVTVLSDWGAVDRKAAVPRA